MKNVLINFLEEIETYQSNHYGNYNRRRLIDAYNSIPIDIKKLLLPNKNKLKNLYRGCDGISENRVISFTDNKSWASYFGHYTLPFVELKSYSALIDTKKVRILLTKLKKYNINNIEIGDDEGEVIVLNPIWKPNLNLDTYKSQR